MIEKRLVTSEELTSGIRQGVTDACRVPDSNEILKMIASGGPTRMELDIRPAFDVGEKVRVTSNNPTTHTRVPRYTRNHIGPIKASA